MKLYLKIKEIRQQKGLTQKELAKLINVHQVVVSEYELGKVYPSLERAVQIAIALDVAMDDLIDMDKYISDYHKDLNRIKNKKHKD